MDLSSRNKHFFLSNFYLMDINYKGCVYKSADHLFQGEKCTEQSDKGKIRNAETTKRTKIQERCAKMKTIWELEKTEKLMEKILMGSSFRNNHFFLSNFYLIDIKYRGHIYKSAEHLFQAEKCVEESDREKIRNAVTPKLAKIRGRFVKMRSDWELKKTEIMEKILRLKFRKSKMKKMLRETGDAQLIELNYWHDTFWGVCTCTMHKRTGMNMLGIILMKIRDEIK